MYRHGEGCVEDKKKAMELFEESSKQGNERALFNLGTFFFHYSIFFRSYNDAGEMHEKGEGCPKDKSKAFDYYKQSADLGYSLAQFTIGTTVIY